MKTFLIREKDIKKGWRIVDAKDQVLGRLAAKVAHVLRGKDKVCFAPHQDVGDEVIVINASKVRVTGKKAQSKVYKSYSEYPGGLNEVPYVKMMARKPEYIIRHAVEGMLPKTKLGAKMLKKLRVYAGDKHPHQAQNPKELKIA